MKHTLTNQQIETFNTDGYIVIRQLIPRDMLDELTVDYDRATRGELDVPEWKSKFGKGKTLQLGHPSRKITGWEDHAYRKIIVDVGKQLLGDDIEYSYDQMIFKPPGSDTELLWHQDAGYGWKGEANGRSTTCWLAFSKATKAMGSLQFIPDSHQHGIVEHIDATDRSPIQAVLEAVCDPSLAETVEYEPGDATFHHGRTLHYSEGNSTDEPRKGLSTHLWPASAIRS